MEREQTGHAAPAGSPLATKEPWDIVADAYAADLVPWAEHFAGKALQLASLPPSPRIVDLAAGPGSLALFAAREGATVSAIGFSTAMVANLRRRADDLELVFFADRAAGVRELRRVLRQGRRAVVGSIASIEAPFAQVLEAIQAMLPSLPISNGKMPLSDPEEFMREMSSAGFHQVSIHTVTYHAATPSLTEFWQKTQRSAAPVALLRHKLGEAHWLEVANGVLDQLQATLGDGPVEELYTMHLGVGAK